MTRFNTKIYVIAAFALAVMSCGGGGGKPDTSGGAAKAFPLTTNDIGDVQLLLCINKYAELNGWTYTYQASHLDCSDARIPASWHISNISGISILRNLTLLNLSPNPNAPFGASNNRIEDASELSKLTKLQHLNLESHIISDLEPLQYLGDLTTLNINGNTPKSLAPLYGLSQLRTLHLLIDTLLYYPELDTLSEQLSALVQLEVLEYHNASDVGYASLSKLTNLKSLKLPNVYNKGTNFIANLTKLEQLTVTYAFGVREQSSISVLENLTELKYLHIGEVAPDWSVVDNCKYYEPLRKLTKLESVALLSFGSSQPCIDISYFDSAPKIRYFSVTGALLNFEKIYQHKDLNLLWIEQSHAVVQSIESPDVLVSAPLKLAEIETLTDLKTLLLVGASIDQLPRFGLLPELTELHVANMATGWGYTTPNPYNWAPALEGASNIEFLNLRGSTFDKFYLLEQMPQLKFVDLQVIEFYTDHLDFRNSLCNEMLSTIEILVSRGVTAVHTCD